MAKTKVVDYFLSSSTARVKFSYKKKNGERITGYSPSKTVKTKKQALKWFKKMGKDTTVTRTVEDKQGNYFRKEITF
jgi:uncharacterized protein YggE